MSFLVSIGAFIDPPMAENARLKELQAAVNESKADMKMMMEVVQSNAREQRDMTLEVESAASARIERLEELMATLIQNVT